MTLVSAHFMSSGQCCRESLGRAVHHSVEQHMAETLRLVRLISTTTVGAAACSPEAQSPHRIELTPWDLQLLQLGPIQKGLLFLKPPTPSPQHQHFPVVQHLKRSLSRTLDFFPILAGRLGVSHNADGTSSFFVDCNNAGTDFVHAVADNVTVADILEPVFVPRIVHSFFPLNGLRNIHGVSDPLLAVQVTELVEGAVGDAEAANTGGTRQQTLAVQANTGRDEGAGDES
ncbi:protein ENHANCED PSEUDOMONAS SUSCEPTIBILITY 1-like [Diospyros lotus]|uniref:protein ENHANCED PSEUDOMONAS SUSCEPTIBILITY 1-like n=1 Tax=Diospyros lotus TaxID=55363 RepID=UPI00224D34E7|nr:protein ENHANCED PSEUDOMONAS SUSCEPTIBILITY 1-like [Diospyros lotus]